MSEENTAAKTVAYIGPDIVENKVLAVSHGTVFKNGLPEVLEKKVEEIPAMKSLLVSVSDYATASAAVATPGTALNNIFRTVSGKLK